MIIIINDNDGGVTFKCPLFVALASFLFVVLQMDSLMEWSHHGHAVLAATCENDCVNPFNRCLVSTCAHLTVGAT